MGLPPREPGFRRPAANRTDNPTAEAPRRFAGRTGGLPPRGEAQGAAERNDETSHPPGASGNGRSNAGRERYVDGIYALNKDYLLSYPRTAWRVVTAPVRFGREDWLATAAVAGTAGVLFALDSAIKNFWQDNIQSDTSTNILRVFGAAGNFLQAEFTALGVYALAEVVDQTRLADLRREKAAALMAAESVLISEAIADGIKFTTGRKRPNATGDRLDFAGPPADGRKSLPSGHATTAFALAASLSEVYGDEHPWAPWFLYGWATGTALSRIDNNHHWASDVFLGSVLGYAIGKTVTRLRPFLEKNALSLRPLSSGNARGAAITYRF